MHIDGEDPVQSEGVERQGYVLSESLFSLLIKGSSPNCGIVLGRSTGWFPQL